MDVLKDKVLKMRQKIDEIVINNLITNINNRFNIKLKWIDGVHINKNSYLTLIDDDGYKYYTRVYVLKQNTTPPQKFHSGNIYTLDNFKLWMSKNADGYELLSTTYVNAKSKLCFKCPEGHIFYMNRDNFMQGQRCPECNLSKGEQKIKEHLVNNNIKFEEQKEFCGLLGVYGKNLSYDFYLQEHNLLIEYQGEFHDGTTRKQTAADIERQQEHDRRKREYANNHGIDLLEIWYYDFDNIETILNNKLKSEKETCEYEVN